MIRSFLFYARLVIAWYLLFLVLFIAADWIWAPLGNAMALVGLVTVIFVIIRAHSHLRRVRMLNGGKLDATALASRQHRQIEMPFEADEAFDLLEAAIRKLPGIEHIDSVRNRLEVRAVVTYSDPYGIKLLGRYDPMGWIVSQRNRVLATVTRGDGNSSLTLIFEPASAPWSDWLQVDDGINLEHAKAVTHAITLAMAEHRRGEQAAAAQTITEKELAIAKLSLLQAQVEPHFLYNTLANAQYLVRSDAAAADEMLGHLIQYLRHSLPRTDHALSTLGDELERSRAYLEILKIRMGPRLTLQIDVPDELLATPMPPMMLQTLVENAIKHGLEPRPGEGTVWIFARRHAALVAVTVADDGLGFNTQASSGIGLKNVRERLQLIYGAAGTLVIAANFPQGVAATISVPADVAGGQHHG
ncbi:histidine kinase [Rhodanobacter glycinis]|uniref:histidine kinase n=1 Tax=Rhodanobacter glycinis TaxID=582702 RepID=UPI0031B8B1FC